MLVNEPLGVLLAIEPWNYPLYQVVRVAGPNLTLGNTILLKHAQNCPQTALALEELFRDAGVPEGVYTNGLPELGGSHPFVVLDGERLERTVDAAAKGRLGNTGQSCVASKRFIVLAGCYDAFVSGLRDRFADLEPGDPADPETRLRPLSSERAATNLIEQVKDAVDKGATVVIGGGRPDRPGAFVEPTILTDVTPEMGAYHEELFGPVAVVYRVADRIASGMIFINRPALSRPELPFGGIKRSGYGRELSELGMQEFASRKLIFSVAPDAPVGGFTG